MIAKYQEQINKSNDEVKRWANTVLAAALRKSERETNEVEHILDFLNSPAAPKRLRRMSYEQAKAGATKWVAALIKKGENIDDSAHIKGRIKFKDGFRLVRLVGKPAFEREGNLMRHCVASYYGKKEVTIYSLRDPNNNPHCTMEVTKNDNQAVQIKGKGNGSIHPKYISKVVYCLKKFGAKVRESEMSNLGYVVPTTEELAAFSKAGIDIRMIVIDGVQYMYIY